MQMPSVFKNKIAAIKTIWAFEKVVFRASIKKALRL